MPSSCVLWMRWHIRISFQAWPTKVEPFLPNMRLEPSIYWVFQKDIGSPTAAVRVAAVA